MKSPFTALLATSLALSSVHAAEVFEIGESNYAELPGGKEADGIIGDFVIRNGAIEAVISGNLPLRRPNMSAFYGDGNHTPGRLYDLTIRGANNDQLTIFTPMSGRGDVNFVRVLPEEAGIEVFISGAKGALGIERTHVYSAPDAVQGLLITSQLVNRSDKDQKFKASDYWTQMREKGSVDSISWADAIDPADKCGYAYSWIVDEEKGWIKPSAEVTLKPGETLKVARFLAVGTSPAEAVGLVREFRGEKVTPVSIELRNADVSAAKAMFQHNGKPIWAYPNDKGVVEFLAPPGEHRFVVDDIGREQFSEKLTVGDSRFTAFSELPPQSAVNLSVRGPNDKSIPCKIQFIGIDGTNSPDLGPTDRAHGCKNQYHSETGDFRVPLPVGKYEVVVTHGPEFSHHAETIDLGVGKEVTVSATLGRVVDTSGWISTDYHNHSTPSGDNTCGTDDRLINMAAENLEFTPTTEHNRLYDWTPHIEKLGLAGEMATIPGMELTGRGAHFNMFPLKPDPTKQDGGAPVWQKDPRLNAIVLRGFQGEDPDRWIHVNHPDMTENFVDRNGDGRVDGGYAYFGNLIDGLESQNYRNSNILASAPYEITGSGTGVGRKVNPIREFVWLQLLNQGLPVWGIAVSDAHHVFGNGTGAWRTYVKSSTDDPAEVDWRELTRNSKAGRMILSSGPYLEVATESGIEAGGYDRISGKLKLKVKVQCSDWLDIDRVQVLVNGRQLPEYNFTREANADMFADDVTKFDQSLELDLSEDAHIIVVATGENSTLERGFGASAQGKFNPTAYNNPIFIDVDGNGFSPNHDTLGYDLPVKGLTVDQVERALGRNAQ